MSAKNDALATLGVLKDCLNDQALVDKAPTDYVHNRRAAALRQGLAVLTFSAVETFIRERTGEVLGSFASKVRFSDLSPALQKATTIGALDGVRFRLKLQAPVNKISWLVTNIAPIATAATDIKNLSPHSFGYATSNLEEDDVRDILKAFGVESPWTQMTNLCSRVNLALPNCEAEFETIRKRRHSSAHALTSSVLHSQLEDSLRSSRAICLAFDLLLSHCLGLYNQRRSSSVATLVSGVAHSNIRLVFIEPRSGGDFGVKREQLPPPSPTIARPTVRVFGNEAAALGKV